MIIELFKSGIARYITIEKLWCNMKIVIISLYALILLLIALGLAQGSGQSWLDTAGGIYPIPDQSFINISDTDIPFRVGPYVFSVPEASGSSLTWRWLFKAGELYDRGVYNNALLFANQAVSYDPWNAEAWYSRGSILGQLGRYPESLISYDQALEINPQNARAWNGKAVALSALGQNDAAEESFNQAVTINPSFAEAWTNRGGFLYRMGSYEDALTSFDQALRVDPSEGYAWIGKGQALTALGRDDEASVAFSTAQTLLPASDKS
jgi:tetratricopeptide (TPR) repeat protein